MTCVRDIPQAEFEVMEVLWQKGEATVKEVQALLGKDRKSAYTTVATLLTRLKEKGYVSAEERSFAYVFRPLVPRERVVRYKLDDLVRRVLGGKLAPLAAYIAENRKLSKQQIEALEAIIRAESHEKKR
jgi:BlaI family transcriptional regulator, penicillinase repressor